MVNKPISSLAPLPLPTSRAPIALLLIFGAIWLVLAVEPLYRQAWLLENIIVLIALPMLVIAYPKFRLSNTSYLAIFVFLSLHEIGAHYTYSEVPYDEWARHLSGYSLNEVLGWKRNHFDRILHLLYGLLIVYPCHEAVVRFAGFRGYWSYIVPVLIINATSTLYELIEWGAAAILGGDLGMAYLGTQGDIWDAHKDMAWANFGAVSAVFAIIVIRHLDSRTTEEDVTRR
jgi:putative membrane protein